MKNISNRFNLKLLSPLTCLVATLVAAVCLLVFEDEYLWKVQELNLHLDTTLFFQQQMVVSGGLLTWLGTAFTEFFYHPLLGTALLTLWWWLLMYLASRAFSVPLKWSALLLLPVAMLLLTQVDMGYWIYYLKLRGHFFSATIALCVVCAAVWLFRCLPARYWMRQAMMVLTPAVLYPLLGIYGLLATLLMAVMVWRMTDETGTQRIVGSVLALVAIVAVPLICYRTIYSQTSLDNIWFTALPLYRIDETLFFAYYIPYIFIALFFIVLAATYGRLCSGDVAKPRTWIAVHVVLLVVLVGGVRLFWYDDYNFHKELRMQRCLGQQDWDGILQEATDLKEEPTRAMVMMKNLALFRQGKQGNLMYHYLTGAKESNTPLRDKEKPMNITPQVIGKASYLYYGLVNYCYRWCLEDGVEYGWRAEYLKYMTQCALLNGEYRVARKYINMLKHTRYHRQWAEQHERFLSGDDAVMSDQNYATIRRLMNFEDRLSSDQTIIEQFLMNHFVFDASNDPLYQEQAVYAALWTKDIATFWPLFFRYAESHKNEPMPIHLQEAAYLYGHLENRVDISHMPFDESVVNTYQQFMKMAERCRGMSEEQMKEAFFPQFGHTFYYEYFLIRNQKMF